MFKEKDYDEYLEAKVKKGLAEIEKGQIFTLEQANAEWQEIIEQIEREN
ncbi:hypothetical protein DNAOFDDG_00600 [Mannheimia haemolytica]|nr:hypothetical protein [Mannheimia haemolytica]MCB4226934.1 hypothetical protein [Mannheimia haemolytica]MDW0546466.1 hypothetical protein [Mannheimia haemolytica]MDW0572890.1 hypothetical protein [Mannheimia haemolytica]MDW0594157.1 hypothetical protein [Mannheimia haemolytica]MDW0618079.1 hypothetical protein [Mannheimia haemolytica]